MTPHHVRVLGWSFVLVLVTVATTMAHLATTRTMPEADATVEESPDRVQVWFTQGPGSGGQHAHVGGARG